ncbi:hypothetical protein ACP70R_009894 [Stipagrostis hirtigluma subsp. patula]
MPFRRVRLAGLKATTLPLGRAGTTLADHPAGPRRHHPQEKIRALAAIYAKNAQETHDSFRVTSLRSWDELNALFLKSR